MDKKFKEVIDEKLNKYYGNIPECVDFESFKKDIHTALEEQEKKIITDYQTNHEQQHIVSAVEVAKAEIKAYYENCPQCTGLRREAIENINCMLKTIKVIKKILEEVGMNINLDKILNSLPKKDGEW